ncbi:MAG TPA: hypothetical protein VFY36_00550 [Solirubrobacteraceae bacterium]|nr:hypothetical protein [Solirubrobacteraceae bacterium]
MSPEPYVRGQAFVLAILLVGTSVLGSPLAALTCSVVSAFCAWGLRARYHGDVLRARTDIPPHRERLDLILAGDIRAALGVGAVAGALLVGVPANRPDIGVAPASLVLLSGTAAGILLSSLVDWYVILPRISGLLGARPCRGPDTDHARFPRTWRETTRWWYVHRIVAALLLRFGVSYAVVLTVSHQISLPGGASIVGGAAAGSFAAYLAAIPAAVWEAGHPSMIVGRTMRRHDVQRTRRAATIRGRRIALPIPKRRAVGPLRPREYVYDVALESVQLVPAAARERAIPRDEDGNTVYERNPTKIAVRDVGPSRPEPAEPFAGCREQCSGINWYCIENPRCFATK